MKTTLEQHQQEQVEAVRAEFTKLWQGELMPRIVALSGSRSIRELGTLKDIAWRTFCHAKGLAK